MYDKTGRFLCNAYPPLEAIHKIKVMFFFLMRRGRHTKSIVGYKYALRGNAEGVGKINFIFFNLIIFPCLSRHKI